MGTALYVGIAMAIAMSSAVSSFANEDNNASFAAAAVPVYDLVKNGNCAEALPKLRELSTRADFPLSDTATSYAFWKSFLGCAQAQLDFENGYYAARNLTALPQATAVDWRQRAFIGLHLKQWDDSIEALETMAKMDPNAISTMKREDVSISFYYTTIQDAPNLDDIDFRFLTILWSAHWQPTDPAGDVDSLWVDYATRLQSRNLDEQVSKVLHSLREPDSIHNVRMNPQWRDVVQSDPAAFDVLAAANNRLDALASLKATRPELLSVVIAHAKLLRELGRVQQALEELNGVQPKLLPSADRGGFADADDMLRWWTNERAFALRDLGRFDEAIAALRQGTTLREVPGRTPEEQQNISQLINLATLQDSAGRPKDAIETLLALKDTRPMSTFGFANATFARACAYAQLNQHEDFERQVRKLADLGAGWSYIIADALVCANDLDDAAGLFVKNLDEKDGAWRVLFKLSDFAPAPQEAPFAREFRRRMAALAVRPDVQAAIVRSGGHLEQSPLLSW